MAGTLPHFSITRTIHPVGQGAFYSECFSSCEGDEICVVYDCGAFIDSSYLDDYIKINFNSKRIKYLFISHFHEDHINGILLLASKCKIDKIIAPLLSPETLYLDYIYNEIITNGKSVGNKILKDFALHTISHEAGQRNPKNKSRLGFMYQYIDGKRHRRLKFWQYDIWNSSPDEKKNKELIQNIKKEFNLDDLHFSYINKEAFSEISRLLSDENNLKKIAKLYGNIFKNKHNDYSMLVYSHPTKVNQLKICDKPQITCLYTGDANLDNAKSFQPKINWSNIGTVQIPHHGSRHNHNINFYRPGQVTFASCGWYNRFHHPSYFVLEEIYNKGCKTGVITEKSKKYEKTFKL